LCPQNRSKSVKIGHFSSVVEPRTPISSEMALQFVRNRHGPPTSASRRHLRIRYGAPSMILSRSLVGLIHPLKNATLNLTFELKTLLTDRYATLRRHPATL